jgi:hypothetical protein
MVQLRVRHRLRFGGRDEWNVFVAPYQTGATMSATTTMRTVALAAAAADAAVSHEERQVLAIDVLSCASCATHPDAERVQGAEDLGHHVVRAMLRTE